MVRISDIAEKSTELRTEKHPLTSVITSLRLG